MATLPEPYIYDVAGGIRAHQAGFGLGQQQRQNALAQRAGGMAAGGDLPGAANALLEGGDLQGGFGIQDRVRAMAKDADEQSLAKSQRANDAFFRVAMLADTPEKWGMAINQLRGMGIDTKGFDDFGSREMALGRFGQTRDVLGTVLEERKARAISGALMPQAQPAGPQSIADVIEQRESGGDPNARNPRSSATGVGQFIDSTWLQTLKRARPDIATGRSDQELLALRNDRGLSREMINAYAQENARSLSAAGFQPTPGNIRLAHFAGPGGAAAVLRANPATPAGQVLGPEVLRANPFLANMTAGDLVAWADRQMQGVRQGQNALAPQPQQPVRTAGLDYDAGIRAAVQMGDYETASRLQALKAAGRPAKPAEPPSGYRFAADGQNLEFIPGGPADPASKPKGRDKWTEVQTKAANFGNMMLDAEDKLASLAGTDEAGNPIPTENPKNILGATRDALVPFEGLSNLMTPDATQEYNQLARQWIRAKLRKESGAAIGKDEMEQEFRTYFPQYGDGPNTIRRKAEARAEATRGMVAESAGAYDDLFSGRGAQTAAPTQGAAQAPQTVTQQQYQSLPKGAQYIAEGDPERKVRIKQ